MPACRSRPESGYAKGDDASHENRIGHVEHACLHRTDPETEKIHDTSVIAEAIHEIPEPSAKDKGETEALQGTQPVGPEEKDACTGEDESSSHSEQRKTRGVGQPRSSYYSCRSYAIMVPHTLWRKEPWS